MSTGELMTDGVLRDRSKPQPVAFVELLFDVVFVFALIRLSVRLGDELTLLGVIWSLIRLFAVWWIWTLTAWATNKYDARNAYMQVMVIGVMLGSLLIAVAIPTAFLQTGLIFAVTYVVIQLGRPIFIALAYPTSPNVRTRAARVVIWALVSAVPWLGGAFTPTLVRTALWTLAVLIDYTAARVDFRVPGLPKLPVLDWAVAGEHLTERYRQFIIVAFGETILSPGIGLNAFTLRGSQLWAISVSFAVTVLLWRIYFYRAGELLPQAIAVSSVPGHTGRAASDAHLVMVGGLVVTAVGGEVIVDHPFGPVHWSWIVVLLTGPALFLVGRGLLDYVTFSHVSWSRLIGILLLGAMTPAMILLPPILVATAVVVVLAGVAVSNAIAWQRYPRQPLPPNGR